MSVNGEIHNIYNLYIIKNADTIVPRGNFTKETNNFSTKFFYLLYLLFIFFLSFFFYIFYIFFLSSISSFIFYIYIFTTKHKSWDKPTKTAKLLEQNRIKIVTFRRYTTRLYQTHSLYIFSWMN